MSESPRRASAWLGALAAVLLWQGSPGQLVAEWLAPVGGLLATVAGLGALYVVATRCARPGWVGYLSGLLYMLGFSWSLRHVAWGAWAGIGLAGALYTVAAVLLTARSRPRWAPWCFALGIAAVHWLRAHMPEIYYPHGQPAHALYHLPGLLGPVRWGGEVLQNLLLAAVAAWLVEAARAGRPAAWRTAGPALAGLVIGWGLCSAGGSRRPETAGPPAGVRVVLVEPGVPTAFFEGRASFVEVLLDPLVEVTNYALRVAQEPPDLIVWPESSLPTALVGDPARLPGTFERSLAYATRRRLAPLPPGTRLVAGTVWRPPEPDSRRRGVAALFDAELRLVGLHEKQWPVPGGERVPFLGLLPESWAETLVGWVAGVMVRDLPDLASGRPREPLETAAGTPFAALLCYDNAFPGVAAGAVDRGARFLVVASNEAWYRQGAELDQMVALTVFRALESGLPLVRSTVDGPTCHVDAEGRVRAALGRPLGGSDAGGRVLRAEVTPGVGTRSAVLALQAVLGPLVATVFLLVWVVGWLRRIRLRAAEGGSAAGQGAGSGAGEVAG